MPAPIEFHAIRPRRHTKVLTKCVAAISLSKRVESGPAAYSGTAAVGADDPACAHLATAQVHSVRRNAGHGRMPQEIDSQTGGAIRDEPVQHGPSYTHTR